MPGTKHDKSIEQEQSKCWLSATCPTASLNTFEIHLSLHTLNSCFVLDSHVLLGTPERVCNGAAHTMVWWTWFSCVNDHSSHSCSFKCMLYIKGKGCACRSCEENLLCSLSLQLVTRGVVWLVSNAFSYQVWYESSRVGSGSSISHTSGKALPNNHAVSLLLFPCLVTPSSPALWWFCDFGDV